jgi:hypothetical protein
LDAPDGPLAGKVAFEVRNVPKNMEFSEVQIPMGLVGDGKYHDLYFVVKHGQNPSELALAVDWVRFELSR